MKAESKWDRRRRRLFHIIEVGSDFDEHSRWYDYENAGAIILNLIATVLYTFEEMRMLCGPLLELVEQWLFEWYESCEFSDCSESTIILIPSV